jgi:hypothetical protein
LDFFGLYSFIMAKPKKIFIQRAKEKDSMSDRAWFAAVRNGNEAVVKLLLETSQDEVDSKGLCVRPRSYG